MKTPKQKAKILNDHHMRTCAGFYSNKRMRCFSARVSGGILQVSDDWGVTWSDVREGEVFRDHNGREIYL